MKTFLSLLLIAAAALTLRAQTNLTAPPAHEDSNATTSAVLSGGTNRPPTEIFSDSGEFDLKTRLAVYTGNVRVIDPKMNMTCEWMSANVPEGGGRIDHIVALTNVVIDAIDDQTNHIHATSQKAVYTYTVENSVTNEIVELTGGDPLPHVESKTVTGSGRKIVWDRVKGSIRVYEQQHMIIDQGQLKSAMTNSPATNSAPPIPEKN